MVRLDISLFLIHPNNINLIHIGRVGVNVTEQSFRIFTYTLTSTKIFIAPTMGFNASCY
jgi:hypothetical protein